MSTFTATFLHAMPKTATSRQVVTPVRKVVPAADAQEQILRACDDLFYREGARAVGVDAVVKRAGVNKMSLYRQFESKDGLLLHYLARCDERFWTYIEGSVAKHPDAPQQQLVQILEDISTRAAKPHYRGCPFVNVAVEFPDQQHPARQFVLDNKTRLLKRLEEIARAAGAADPQVLAQGIALLMEGAYAGSQTYTPGHPVLRAAPVLGQLLVTQACGAPAKTPRKTAGKARTASAVKG